jgi:hypothetical protein
MPYFGRVMGSGRTKLSDVTPTAPPTGKKKVTNLYYDPTTGELKFTAEA